MNLNIVRIITFCNRLFRYLLIGMSVPILAILAMYLYPSGTGIDIAHATGTAEQNIRVVYPAPTPPIVVNQGTPTTVISNPNVSSYSSSTATGGGGGSANVTVSQPQPVTQKAPPIQTKELPRTGLPELAWGAVALVPIGIKLRKFMSNSLQTKNNNPVFISQKRSFNKHT